MKVAPRRTSPKHKRPRALKLTIANSILSCTFLCIPLYSPARHLNIRLPSKSNTTLLTAARGRYWEAAGNRSGSN